MPRNVRNYWVEPQVDGRDAVGGFGPRAKQDGMSLSVYQRDRGDVSHVLTITGQRPRLDGRLSLIVQDARTGERLAEIVTER